MTRTYRIGQIVPSSNTTMETEIPALLNARAAATGERFTFHSARMRMKHVTREELARMDAGSDDCALALSDARVDVLGYACLVAIMSMGKGYHRVSQERLHAVTVANDAPAPVVTSAGALCDALHVMGAKKIAVVTPYMQPLTRMVCEYIEDQGISVIASHSREVADNVAVGRLDTGELPGIVTALDHSDADVIVLSACVQMPSLDAVEAVERATGKPVITAAIATTYWMLEALGLDTKIEGAGALLSGRY